VPFLEGHGMVYQRAAFFIKVLAASDPPDVPFIIPDWHMTEVKPMFRYLLAHLGDIVGRRPAQDRKGRNMTCGKSVL
jgi:hypothetical protein